MVAQGNIPHDARDWLALFSVPGVGATRFMQLVSAFGSPGAALQARAEDWMALPGFGNKTVAGLRQGPDEKFVSDQMRALERSGASMALFGNEDYPSLLAKIPQAPPFFFYHGRFAPRDARGIAIVGARTPTTYGRKMTYTISEGLARAGLTVVSGLAAGVDGIAHQAALEVGGRTIAVFGCGLNTIYPREHRSLAERIAKSGVLISEFPFDTGPTRENFPKRNRVISGLSLGTVIVEARGISGALHTAHHALEQNREVFAVPGSAVSELSVGTNNLIKAGARLVTGVEDVLSELGVAAGPEKKAVPPPTLSPLQRRVYDGLSETPCHIDTLALALEMSVGELATVLLDLELIGVAGQVAGKQFCRTG